MSYATMRPLAFTCTSPISAKSPYAALNPAAFTLTTGRGLLIGMHFHNPEVGYKVAAGLFKRGVLVGGTLTSAHPVRIEPPLVIPQGLLDEVLNRLSDTLTEVKKTL